MQRKSPSFLTIIRIGLLNCVALAGCHGTLEPPSPPPYQDVVLRVACPPPLAPLIGLQSSAWQARQQARVEIVDPGKSADVWIITPGELPDLAVKGKLLPVPAALRERGNAFEWSTLLPFYREQLVMWADSAYALPLVGESPLCLYRADLFASRDHQQKFRDFQVKRKLAGPIVHLRPPSTWEEYARIAEYFQEHHPSGKPAPSLAPLPAGAAQLDRLFFTVAASFVRRARPEERKDEHGGPDFLDDLFSFHYDQQTGEPRIATPGFVAALELLQRLQACRPPGTLADPTKAFRDGSAVLALADARVLLAIQRAEALRDKDGNSRVGICLVPGNDYYYAPSGKKTAVKQEINRVPYLGGAGWLAAVAADSSHSGAAFDLLTDLCGPARSTQIVQEPSWGGGPVRTDQVLRDHGLTFDLDTERSSTLRETLTRTIMHGLLNPALCLRTPDALAQRDVLGHQLREALSGRVKAEAALKTVASEWQQMNAKKGKNVHLRELWIGLGLKGREVH